MNRKKSSFTGRANGVDVNAALQAALAQAPESVDKPLQTFKISATEVVRGGFTGGVETVVTIEPK